MGRLFSWQSEMAVASMPHPMPGRNSRCIIRAIGSEKPMILKIALLMWFVALALSLFAKANGRALMMRFFIGGFCLLLLGFFLKILSRVI